MHDRPRFDLTYADYANFPEGERWEIIDGERFLMSPAPNTDHQRVVVRLLVLLNEWAKRNGGEAFISPVDVILSDHNIVQPDVLYVGPSRGNLVAKRGIEGAPDLICEVVSPTRPLFDRETKKALYARFGVLEYWIADPDLGTVEVFVLGGKGYRLHGTFTGDQRLKSPLLPKLRVIPAHLFAGFSA